MLNSRSWKVEPPKLGTFSSCWRPKLLSAPRYCARLCSHYKGLWGLVVRVRYHQSGLPSSICNHKLTHYHITQLLYNFITVMECQAEYRLWVTGLVLGLLPESSAVILSCAFPLTWIFCEQESAFTTSFAPLPLTVWVALAKSHSLAQFFHLDTSDNCKACFPNKVFQNSQVKGTVELQNCVIFVCFEIN